MRNLAKKSKSIQPAPRMDPMHGVRLSEVVARVVKRHDPTAQWTIEVSPAHAREALLEAAQDLQQRMGRSPNDKERTWFCLEAFEDDLFVRGESSVVLAEVWGLHTNTVDHSAATAAHMWEDVDRTRTGGTTRALRRSDSFFQRALCRSKVPTPEG